jgi:hypothetical protein
MASQHQGTRQSRAQMQHQKRQSQPPARQSQYMSSERTERTKCHQFYQFA